MVARGIRNNNPGNIRKLNVAWVGMADLQTDKDYVIFTEMAYGIRAMAKILMTYQRSHGLNTVRTIINRWAPPVDNNDTKSYVAYVARVIGVDPNFIIDVKDYQTMQAFIEAMVKQECGCSIAPDDMHRGMQMAGIVFPSVPSVR